MATRIGMRKSDTYRIPSAPYSASAIGLPKKPLMAATLQYCMTRRCASGLLRYKKRFASTVASRIRVPEKSSIKLLFKASGEVPLIPAFMTLQGMITSRQSPVSPLRTFSSIIPVFLHRKPTLIIRIRTACS